MKYKLAYDREFISRVSNTLGKTRLVLASNSPRRTEILKMLGLSFEKIVPEIDENISVNSTPSAFAVKLAGMKAKAVDISDPGLVIGADTIVVLDDAIIGKPADRQEAGKMLSMLSGKTHTVYTGVALRDILSGRSVGGFSESRVRFKIYSDEDINSYINSGEPFGKAGAYAIQGIGGELVESYEGDLDNIIGFPSRLFIKLYKELKSEV